ncbi:TolC family protein [Sphingomonas paeninsulae]|uniref:TolC family protein n=1 Tax=Sphingomonas paeninsulae TaxID=2319844 RepID=UPI0026B8AB17
MADRRPDLVALRLGYDAQDANVRVAILSQFPDLILGATASSDNSSVINGGPQATIGLPIFDRNQGNVAIANATRAQLHGDYSARLAAAAGQVGALLSEMDLLSEQLAIVRRDLPAARLAAERAANAFGASNLDERSYVDLVVNRYTKEQEVVTLELGLLDRQVALQTLVGAGLPPSKSCRVWITPKCGDEAARPSASGPAGWVRQFIAVRSCSYAFGAREPAEN